MKIAIASGKGGTGKTFVSTNLFWVAQYAGKNCVLVDCDAEAPNVGEFLKGEKQSQEDVTQLIPVINQDACVFCGKCYEYCNYNAIFYLPERKMIQLTEELCHSCGACVVACKHGAITEKVKKTGTITKFQYAPNATILETRTEIGTASSVPIIKKGIKAIEPNQLALLDAPPGISCPFIATVESVDFVLLVTEPTPFGLNDLKLSVETLQKMQIPHAVVINRSGLGNQESYNWLKEQGIEILLEIPFDKEIAKIYSEGKMLSEVNETYRNQFLLLLEKIISVRKEPLS
ncbi:MAG: ATP-binding protein [Paludibacteraceae bacterium]|nr:ATP-binding protein [Paludibacteraceae bacterium]